MKELINGFKMDYKKSTNYHQMWRARDLVRDWYLGGQRKSFHIIPSLMDRIKEGDPDSVLDWSNHEDSRIFNRAFICPNATRSALRFNQPLVCVDACHTKNRKYPTQLFVATVLDGFMHGVIMCYALAPVENTDNWTWFLHLMLKAIDGINDVVIPLVSDR